MYERLNRIEEGTYGVVFRVRDVATRYSREPKRELRWTDDV